MKKTFVNRDFSSIESRVLAYAEAQGDMHTKRAAEEFGVLESEVTPDMRRVGKQLNYFKMYGTSKGEAND